MYIALQICMYPYKYIYHILFYYKMKTNNIRGSRVSAGCTHVDYSYILQAIHVIIIIIGC